MRLPIRFKLILAIGIPLAVVYAVMLVILVRQIGARTHAQLESTAGETATQYAALVGARLESVARGADSAATLLGAIADPSDHQLREIARAAMGSDSLIRSSHVVPEPRASASSGAVLVVARRSGEGIAFTELSDWEPPGDHPVTRLTESASGAAAAWSDPYLSETSGAVVVSHVAPVTRMGKVVGAVTVDLSTEEISERLGGFDPDDVGASFSVLHRDGRWVTPPEVDDTVPDDSTPASIGEAAERLGRADLVDLARRLRAGETGVFQTEGVVLPGQRWVFFAPIPGTEWTFVGTMPESVVLAFSRSRLQLGLGIMLAGLLSILVMVWLMATRITRPIARLAHGVEGLAGGDLDTRVTGVETGDEIGDLAEAFNRMVADLKAHVDALTRETAARESVESELRVARKIQTSLLPKEFPSREELETFAVNIPAKQVAGDFYDFFYLDDDTLVFLIADVSGKGVPAALFMAMARTVLRHVCATSDSISKAVARANDILENDNIGSMYTTLFLGAYHIPTGAVRYVNGGHPPPYRIGADGSVTPFGEATGTVVGLLPAQDYEERTERLRPGDRIVMFTDGVPEATAPDGEMFGDARTEELLCDLAGEPVDRLCERIASTINDYEAGNPADDVTIVTFSRSR